MFHGKPILNVEYGAHSSDEHLRSIVEARKIGGHIRGKDWNLEKLQEKLTSMLYDVTWRNNAEKLSESVKRSKSFNLEIENYLKSYAKSSRDL